MSKEDKPLAEVPLNVKSNGEQFCQCYDKRYHK